MPLVFFFYKPDQCLVIWKPIKYVLVIFWDRWSSILLTSHLMCNVRTPIQAQGLGCRRAASSSTVVGTSATDPEAACTVQVYGVPPIINLPRILMSDGVSRTPVWRPKRMAVHRCTNTTCHGWSASLPVMPFTEDWTMEYGLCYHARSPGPWKRYKSTAYEYACKERAYLRLRDEA